MELREGPLGGESRLTRHYLHLMDLRPQDAGTYTCAAANPLGAAAANWTLRVIGEERENSSCRNAEVIGLWCRSYVKELKTVPLAETCLYIKCF